MRAVSALILAVILLAIGFAAGRSRHPVSPTQAPLPVLGQVPDYTLTNQLGQATSSTSFHGKVRVVTFLFTYCRGYCPLIAHNLLTLESVLRTAGMADRVQLVAFNVDPAETGPAQMRAFQKQYGWDPSNLHWQFLTGSPEEIRHIVTGAYYVFFKKVGDDDGQEEARGRGTDEDSVPEPVVVNKLADEAHVDYDIMHNDMLAVVDTDGRIRKMFDEADRVSDQELMDVIEQLLPTSERSPTR